MNLKEFRTTKRVVTDLAAEFPDEIWGEPQCPAQVGLVYADTFHIEMVGNHWPEAARNAGKFYLQLGNQEYISDDLPHLEGILYDYACLEMGWTFGNELANRDGRHRREYGRLQL